MSEVQPHRLYPFPFKSAAVPGAVGPAAALLPLPSAASQATSASLQARRGSSNKNMHFDQASKQKAISTTSAQQSQATTPCCASTQHALPMDPYQKHPNSPHTQRFTHPGDETVIETHHKAGDGPLWPGRGVGESRALHPAGGGPSAGDHPPSKRHPQRCRA